MTRDEKVTSAQAVKRIDFAQYRILPIEHSNTVWKLKGSQKVTETKDRHFTVTSDFDYEKETVQMVFQPAANITFTPISAVLTFKRKTIAQPITRLNFAPVLHNGSFVSLIKFDNMNIDFFGPADERSMILDFSYGKSSSSPNVVYTSSFVMRLPKVRDQTEMITVAPKTKLPSEDVKTICELEFEMNAKNSKAEIQLCLDLETFSKFDLNVRYHESGYLKMLRLYLDIENSFEQALLDKCAFSYARLTKIGAGKRFEIQTPWPITNQGERVRLTPISKLLRQSNDANNNNGNDDIQKHQIVANIVSYQAKSIIVEIHDAKLIKALTDSKDTYLVELVPNFFTSAMAFYAMHRIEQNSFEKFLINFTRESLPVPCSAEPLQPVNNYKWCNESVGANPTQTMAIKHIVNRRNFPFPYVVFGPPGTGKTSTLVETVAQIVHIFPKNHVLVTANSNSACDEIGDRLLNYIGHNKMFRYYSPSFQRKMDRVHPKLQPCSNLRDKWHSQPSVQELMSYNVIITTLVNAGRMATLPSDHFDFIFVDECASSSEVYVTIPLSLAMSKKKPFKASIVLLGDPKQLGQIMKTHHCERYKFNVSMMERVMEMDQYKFDGRKGLHNADYITQLVDNFRSHAAILDFSNKNFYNSILQARQVKEISEFALGWNKLPNPQVPLIFHASWTPSQLDGTSHFNLGDIYLVKKYIIDMTTNGINGRKISCNDIGVISPYAVQREKLKAQLPFGTEIGTVEYFQGREKLIIIMSCVRSKTRTIGFLSNQKRLNVALTRAKGLLIVIGNPETLGKNKLWRKFMTSCKLVNAIEGKVPGWMVKRGMKELEKEEKDSDEIVRLEEFMDGLVIED